METNGNKSCLNCPSLLSPEESARFFQKSIGTQVCAKFGSPVGRTDSKRSEIEVTAKHIASKCSEFGKPKPVVVDWARAKFQVMLPDPDTLGGDKNFPDLVKSCNACTNFVREDVVAAEVGFTTALCSAKGKLLLANRFSLEARNCPERSFGPVRTETSGMIFLPEYDRDFVGDLAPIKQYLKNKANFVDPTEYPTDLPVEPDHTASGIRAWREIVDIETGNKVHLPIYHVSHFDAEEQAKIPRTGDKEHPEDYVDHFGGVYQTAMLWTELDETPALSGESGTGKTELFRHMAWLMCLPFERFSITAATDIEDLAGKTGYDPERGTYFERGRVTKAWGKPCVLVVDEPNLGSNEVAQFLRPMTDNSKQLVLDQADGATVDRHNDCYPGLAMNPAWDMRNIGANLMSDADANRLMHIYVQVPPRELEREIIKKRVAHDKWEIPDDKLDTVMAIAEDIRALCDNGTLDITWALRPQLKVARLIRWVSWTKAYRMAIADYLEPAKQELLLDAVRAHTERV